MSWQGLSFCLQKYVISCKRVPRRPRFLRPEGGFSGWGAAGPPAQSSSTAVPAAVTISIEPFTVS